MNLNKEHILKTLIETALPECVAEMTAAVEANKFYVEAIPELGGGYSIGSMDDDLPALCATLKDAKEEHDDCVGLYSQQIVEGDRDDGDEWEGSVMIARITGDNEVSLFEVDDIESAHPTWVGSLQYSMGV